MIILLFTFLFKIKIYDHNYHNYYRPNQPKDSDIRFEPLKVRNRITKSEKLS